MLIFMILLSYLITIHLDVKKSDVEDGRTIDQLKKHYGQDWLKPYDMLRMVSGRSDGCYILYCIISFH